MDHPTHQHHTQHHQPHRHHLPPRLHPPTPPHHHPPTQPLTHRHPHPHPNPHRHPPPHTPTPLVHHPKRRHHRTPQRRTHQPPPRPTLGPRPHHRPRTPPTLGRTHRPPHHPNPHHTHHPHHPPHRHHPRRPNRHPHHHHLRPPTPPPHTHTTHTHTRHVHHNNTQRPRPQHPAHPTPPPPNTPSHWNPNGTVLITGGTGALGTHLTHWLTHHGIRHIHLASRQGPNTPGNTQLTQQLAQQGTHLTTTTCDITNPHQLTQLLTSIPPQHPLTAIIHTAATLHDTTLTHLTPTHLTTTHTPKAHAATLLHHHTQHLNLNAFILFSSAAATLGSPGQANYAAANAHLDALATHRHTQGLPATSIAWGRWTGNGLANTTKHTQWLERGGLRGMDPERALLALEQALTRDEPCITIADIDWERFAPSFTSVRPAPLLSAIPEAQRALARAAAPGAQAKAVGTDELRSRLAGLAAAEQERVLRELVSTHASLVLGFEDARPLSAGRSFRELGFDSLTAVELRNRMQNATGLELPTTLVFDHPSPGALAQYLRDELCRGGPDGADVPDVSGDSGSSNESSDKYIEAWRLPLPRAGSASAWARGPVAAARRRHGRDVRLPHRPGLGPGLAVRPGPRRAPAPRTSARAGSCTTPGTSTPGSSGSPRARHSRWTRSSGCSWRRRGRRFERAGIDPQTLRGSRTGVFAGTNGQDYAGSLVDETPEGAEGYLATGCAASVMSGRLSTRSASKARR
jgi:short-subunit dehydrogenase/acyl carrier protein